MQTVMRDQLVEKATQLLSDGTVIDAHLAYLDISLVADNAYRHRIVLA